MLRIVMGIRRICRVYPQSRHHLADRYMIKNKWSILEVLSMTGNELRATSMDFQRSVPVNGVKIGRPELLSNMHLSSTRYFEMVGQEMLRLSLCHI